MKRKATKAIQETNGKRQDIRTNQKKKEQGRGTQSTTKKERKNEEKEKRKKEKRKRETARVSGWHHVD